MKTFQYKLYPTKPQKRLLERTIETCRHFYNECLADRKEEWEYHQRRVSKTEQLRYVKIAKQCNPYARDVHSHVLQVVVSDLDKAFQAFFRRLRVGESPGYPRFKGRGRLNSFGLKEYGNGFKVDGRRLRIFGIGRVAVRWHRPIEGKIKTLRVIQKPDGWYASFACEVDEPILEPTGQDVGVDVGISSLLSTSDGEQIENPSWYRERQKKLRVFQRRVSRRLRGSARRRKAVHELALFAQHIARQRKDFLNKIVFDLVQRYDLIAVEDLKITNMVKNHHLAKSILDVGWGYLTEHLKSKAEWAGRQVQFVNPKYTSQTCSGCDERFPEKVPLSMRWVECKCGLSMDRDINAAINILKRAGRVRRESSSALAGFFLEAAPL